MTILLWRLPLCAVGCAKILGCRVRTHTGGLFMRAFCKAVAAHLSSAVERGDPLLTSGGSQLAWKTIRPEV